MTDKVLDNWKSYLREEKKESKNAAAGFIIYCPSKDSILLLRRAPAQEDYVGELTGPFGGSEEEEDAFQTAVRETKEEIGSAHDFSGKDYENIYEEHQENLIFTTFLMGSTNEFSCTLNPEHDACGWIDIDEVSRAIEKKGGILISNKFLDHTGKKIEVKAKIHNNTIAALKKFNI